MRAMMDLRSESYASSIKRSFCSSERFQPFESLCITHISFTMDKLSGLVSKLGGKGSHSSSNSGSAGQEDYADKGELQ
jgi:hypothetical protein